MREVLTQSQQTGDEFKASLGIAQVLLTNAQSGETYKFQVRSKLDSTWVDTDVEFTANGVQTFYVSSEFLYRMIAEAPGGIGARAFLTELGYDSA